MKPQTKTHFFMVFANPLPGTEEEFNRWYNEQHVPDLLKLPNYVAAQRFELSEHQYWDSPQPQKYLVIYEIHGEDLQASLDSLHRALENGDIAKSTSFDWDTMATHVYSAITDRIVAQ